jgi:hypothetical protein
MSSSSVPEGPGSVSGAPNLPEGFTDIFASRYVDTGDLAADLVEYRDRLDAASAPGPRAAVD